MLQPNVCGILFSANLTVKSRYKALSKQTILGGIPNISRFFLINSLGTRFKAKKKPHEDQVPVFFSERIWWCPNISSLVRGHTGIRDHDILRLPTICSWWLLLSYELFPATLCHESSLPHLGHSRPVFFFSGKLGQNLGSSKLFG